MRVVEKSFPVSLLVGYISPIVEPMGFESATELALKRLASGFYVAARGVNVLPPEPNLWGTGKRGTGEVR